MYTDEQCKAFWDFDETPSIKEITEQLQTGLIHSTEYAQKVLAHWENFRSMPQNVHLNLPKL